MRSKTLGINVRVTPEEKEKLLKNAGYCALSLSEYLRRLGLGKDVEATIREKVADDAGESKDQVRRYIRLTYLIPELLEMVDENKIAFNPAVEISYLDKSEQRVLLDAMEQNDCTPSHAQAIRLKKLSQEGVLSDQTIYETLAEQKPNQQEQFKFKREEIRKYFPKSYTDKQVYDTVLKLLEQWQRKRERDRDAR